MSKRRETGPKLAKAAVRRTRLPQINELSPIAVRRTHHPHCREERFPLPPSAAATETEEDRRLLETSAARPVLPSAQSSASGYDETNNRSHHQHLLNSVQCRLLSVTPIPAALHDLAALTEALQVVIPSREEHELSFIDLSVALEITAERLDGTINALALALQPRPPGHS